jgi:multisubunit Na+/H+ antiporter MnhE subunit
MGLLVSGALYLLLIDTTSLPELYVGAAISLLAALGFEAAREQGAAEASAALRWLLRAWRPLARIPPDVARLAVEAIAQVISPRPRRGSFRAVPFSHGDPASGRDSGRRALSEAAGSLAPNTIVIGIDPDRDLLLVHQLRRQGDRSSIDVMGLG